MKYLWLILAVWAACFPVWADEASPVIYSRTIIRIVPSKPPAPPTSSEPAGKKDTTPDASRPSEILPQLARVPKEFTLEVRPLQFLSQRDFIAEQPFSDNGGMIIVVDPPRALALKSTNLLAKVDVLFVDENGLIAQIAPNLSLASLTDPIEPEKPIKTLIFLKAGMTTSSNIVPGDHVENAIFKSHPVLLDAPAQPK